MHRWKYALVVPVIVVLFTPHGVAAGREALYGLARQASGG
jgi:hypothetical protein